MGVDEITYTPNAAVDVVELRALLQQTSWAKDRRLEDIRRSLRSQPHVVATHGPKMIGFAKAITDGIYRAVIDDVIVDADYRGRGIGLALVRHLLTQLALVEQVFLRADSTLVPFYDRLGFSVSKYVMLDHHANK